MVVEIVPIVDLAFKSLADFRAKDLLTESSLNLQSVKLQKEKSPPIALEKVAERRWRFKEPANYGLADYESETPSTGAPASTPTRLPCPTPAAARPLAI